MRTGYGVSVVSLTAFSGALAQGEEERMQIPRNLAMHWISGGSYCLIQINKGYCSLPR